MAIIIRAMMNIIEGTSLKIISDNAAPMNGESGELFMRYLKSYLQELFGKYKSDFSSLVPEDFLLNHLSGSFAEAIKWWMMEDTKHSPEDVISFYMTMIGYRK